MDPKNNKTRQIYHGGPTVNKADANDIFDNIDNIDADNYQEFGDLYSSI
jgi:predicted small secreted protein